MLYDVTGDLVKDRNFYVFCHQTNCRGVMGSGIAKQIAETYPTVEARNRFYYEHCMATRTKMLGTILFTRTHDGRICVNMYAQDAYGTYKRQTDYDAFAKCLSRLAEELIEFPETFPPDTRIAFPDHIGCGLAGGDWKIVRKMIEDFGQKIPQDVYIVQLPSRKERA